jgi:uncharacterized membrane protein HdeD (DUF308 family)
MVSYKSDFGRAWGMILVLGLILMVLGVIAVSIPRLTAVATFSVIGWVLLLAGVFQFSYLFSSHTRAWVGIGPSISLAVFYSVIGFFIISYPHGATDLIISILSLFFLIGGVFKIVLAVQLRPLMYWRWLLVTGCIGVLLAIYLTVQPAAFKIEFLGYLIGFYLMLHGISLIFSAAAVRSFN